MNMFCLSQHEDQELGEEVDCKLISASVKLIPQTSKRSPIGQETPAKVESMCTAVYPSRKHDRWPLKLWASSAIFSQQLDIQSFQALNNGIT